MDIFLQQVINGVAVASIYALIAIGITVVYGLTGIINFAQGEFMMIGAFVALAATQAGSPYVLACVAAVAALAGLGFVAERGLFRFTLRRPINGFIISLGLVVFLQGLAVKIWSPNAQTIPSPVTTVWELGEIRVPAMRVVAVAATVAICAALITWLARSRQGIAVTALSEDRETAALMGIPVGKYIAGVFILGSALAGAGGALLLGMFPVTPYVGATFAIKGFIVALLGGLGSVPGVLVAALILGLVEAITAGYLSPEWTDAYAFAVMLAVLIFKPYGLFRGSEGPTLAT